MVVGNVLGRDIPSVVAVVPAGTADTFQEEAVVGMECLVVGSRGTAEGGAAANHLVAEKATLN